MPVDFPAGRLAYESLRVTLRLEIQNPSVKPRSLRVYGFFPLVCPYTFFRLALPLPFPPPLRLKPSKGSFEPQIGCLFHPKSHLYQSNRIKRDTTGSKRIKLHNLGLCRHWTLDFGPWTRRMLRFVKVHNPSANRPLLRCYASYPLSRGAGQDRAPSASFKSN